MSLRLFVLVLCLALISVAHAQIDAMQLRLLEPYSQGLRWDNIESAPAWINGVKPEYHDDWGMHRVRLAPKQQVTVFLPAYESLRLYHPKQTLDNKELDIYASGGTGLAVKQNLQLSSDGHSLVLSPHSATPLLVHITRKCCRAGDVNAALFVSRKVPLGEIAPYRNLVWSSAQWCWLGQEPFTLPELYKQLPAQQKQRFELAGPARIAIKNRLHYEQYAGDLAQDYRIHYWLDDDKAQVLNFSTNVETGRVITVNGSIEVVGREEQAYIEIPTGRHRLVLQADRPLYVQLLAQTEQDYLFRSLNNPRLPVESIRNQGLLTTTELYQQAQTAKRIAQDNSHKAGGLIASNLLHEAALKHSDYPAGLTEAEQLRSSSSYFRDLLPSKKADSGAQFMAYFLTETLQAINRPSHDILLADQHLAEALKRVSQAYFTPLTKVGSAGANEYALPEQQTDGFLRLIVDKRNCVPGFLHIQIDQQITKDLWLRCQPDLEPEAFTRSLAETALMRLQQKPDNFNASLEALFSTYSEPARVIATAVYEIPLPKSARTIKLWQVSKPIKPVNVAVQYRASKAFSLSEQGYLARLRDSSGQHVLPQMIENISRTNYNPDQKLSASTSAEQQLTNEWLPLQRLLQTEYRLYKSSVSSYPAAQAATVDQQVIDNEMALSKNAETQQLWLEALEHWGKVVNYSEGLVRQQAQLHQAHVLTKMGEDYLAESLRRYLSLFADASVAEQDITELSDSYQSQNNTTALLTLAAAMSIQRPTAAHSQLLVNALLKNGEYRFALLLGLTLEQQLPLDGLLAAAYQLEWWQTYQWLQDKLPPDRRAFWLGLKAQRQGDYNAALKAWSGVKLKPWHDYLQQGLSLRDRLTRITGQNAPTLYGQWSTWQQQHPGAKTWQNALWHVKDYAGSDTYYAVERDVYAQAVRGTLQRPVVLGIMGPVTLNLQIRPLHQPAQLGIALDGWLQITDNDVLYRYPYTNNLTSQGLAVTGADNLQVGNVVNVTYQVGQGWHEIKLNSEQAPLSIGIQEQRPELPLSVLPPLKTETFAEMGFISRSHNTHPANK